MSSGIQAFACDPVNFELTNEMAQSFDVKGYVLLRGFLDKEELDNVRKTVEDYDNFTSRMFGVSDGQGGQGRLALWKHPGNDVTGMVARCEKVAGTAEKLLGGEVYHYHSKLITKTPKASTGGKFLWHQDYGYWYKNGILYPDLLTVFMPLDPCHKENGCLQILEGSHKCGRIDHELTAGQQQCDQERLQHIKNRLPHRLVEMDPGDALFFHSNLLHCSDANVSDTKRWVLDCCYKASNDPVMVHHCPQYTKLYKVPDSAVRECRNYTDMTGKEFMDPSTDHTIDHTAGEQ